jgi:uncharacterized protein (TIGR00288 family)
MSNTSGAHKIAVFIDLENLAIGVGKSRQAKFEISRVMKRLIEKGDVVFKKAYADWGMYDKYRRPLHEAAVELVEMPGSKVTGKNSADIKMVVDALELCYTKPFIDAFALVSGDSDFSPLVSKLRENNKHIIGIGVKNSTSPLLIDNCDEFLFYDELEARPRSAPPPGMDVLPKKKQEAFEQLLNACHALQRENKALYGSLVKDTMKRLQPQFNEEYHGYSSFSRLLEDAQANDLVTLQTDPRSGTFVISKVND